MAWRSVLLFLLAFSLQGQLKEFKYLGENYFDDELYLGISLRNIDLDFPNAVPAEKHQLNLWTGDFLFYRTNLELGGSRYIMRNKILGEIFFAFGEQFNEIYREEGSSFSNFLIGSHSFNWNTIVRDRWALALGFNFTDLALGSTFIINDSIGQERRYTPAPHGWYLGAGPSFMFDFLISDFFLFEMQGDYTLHFSNLVPLTYGEDAPDHQMPHQYYLSAHLLSRWGLYTGIETSFLRDRSPNNGNASKIEWHIGFRFMM
ncbi:MAG: hypothetical protein ACPGVV_00090 [Croceimicrobium sp.]